MKIKLKIPQTQGTNQYSMGGDIGGGIGTLVGGLIPIPGIGPAIGNMAGQFLGNQVEGLLGAKKRNRLAMKAERENDLANMEMGSLGETQFAKGGKLKLIKGKDDAIEVNGPKHEQGGVNLPAYNAEVEGGETIDGVQNSPFVFSNRLRLPGTNTTFAKAHKKAVKADMGENFIQNLARVQESMKESPVNTSLGAAGRLQAPNRGFADGGYMNTGVSVDKLPYQVPTLGSQSSGSQPNMLQRLGINNVGDAAPYFGAGFNILSGVLGANRAPKLTFKPADRGSLRPIQNMKTTFNAEPQLADSRRAFATLGRNPGVNSNTLLAGHSQRLQQGAQILGQKENIETDLHNRRNLALAEGTQRLDLVDLQNARQTESFNKVAKQQARGANQALVGTGLAQIGENLAMKRADETARRADDTRLAAALSAADPDTLDFFMSNQDSLRKLVKALRAKQ